MTRRESKWREIRKRFFERRYRPLGQKNEMKREHSSKVLFFWDRGRPVMVSTMNENIPGILNGIG